MATSSIFNRIEITTPETARAFLNAIEAFEASQKDSENCDKNEISFHLATKEESAQLFKNIKERFDI